MELDITNWIETGPIEFRQVRKAIHLILKAISNDDDLRANMIIKGGTLMGIRYGSSRITTDIDFSTEKKLSEIDFEKFQENLNDQLDLAEAEIAYGIKCKVQSYKILPNAQGTFPTANIRIAYSNKDDTSQMRRLEEKKGTNIIYIDYSFNEKSYHIEMLELESEDGKIQAYEFCDLLAEKIRSLLQQGVRRRSRVQDVYDIYFLLTTTSKPDEIEKAEILKTLIKKSEGKGIDYLLHIDGIEDAEIIQRSQDGYQNLKDSVKDLPPFEKAYSVIKDFFKSLPWGDLKVS